MRRLIALILTLVVVLPLAACGDSKERRIKSPVDFQLAQYEREEAQRVEAVQEAMLRREQYQANRRASALEREELPDWPIEATLYQPRNQRWSMWNWFVQEYPGVEGATSLEEALQLFVSSKAIDPNSFSLIYRTLDGGDKVEYRAEEVYPAAATIKFPIAFMVYELIDKGEIYLGQNITYDESIHYESSVGEMDSLEDGTELTIGSLLTYMITQSDNIGIKMIDEYLQENVPPNTSSIKRVADRFELKHVMKDNQITALEFSSIMDEFIEQGPENDYLGLLAEHMDLAPFHQFVTGYIPQNVPVYHKYGDLNNYKHDVGIVKTDWPYYFIFLSNGVKDASTILPEIGLLMYCWNQQSSPFNGFLNERYLDISTEW